MRRILIALVVMVTLSTLWLWRGRDLSILVDRFRTVETLSRPVKRITYEGSGTGGLLHADDLALSLNESDIGGEQLNIGTTKEDQLALSFNGKVFPFGPASSGEDNLTATAPAQDVAMISIQHSVLPWPTFFKFNFMTGKSPSRKRHIYQKLIWKKTTGAKLEMLWRYEQYFYPGEGWTEGLMTNPRSTGLIRVEISNPIR